MSKNVTCSLKTWEIGSDKLVLAVRKTDILNALQIQSINKHGRPVKHVNPTITENSLL